MGDLISNKIANKITKATKTSPKNTSEILESGIKISREKYISPEKNW